MNNAIFISLILTAPTIIASAMVMYIWFPTVPREAKHWLMLGIFCGFLGTLVDNAWWGVAWYLRREDDPLWHWWFDNGIYSNIVFRQGFKLTAAYCHVKAAVIEKASHNLDKVFMCLLLSSMILCLLIL